MNKTKRILSLILVIVLIIGMIPTSVLAETASLVSTENVTEFAGGYGTEYHPYIIATKEHLNNVRRYPDAYFIMAKDIEFTDFDFSISGAFYNEGEGWQPIYAENGNHFTGHFNGNGHVIINLQSSVGALFGSLSNATVKNLGLIDGELAYSSIAGSAYNSKIECCYNTGSVIAPEIGDDAGGLVSGISGSTLIYNCYNAGSVTAADAAGGIIASGSDTATVERCYNEGSVSAVNRAGGISATGGNIVASANYGEVSASGSDDIEIGGICGSGATISYCYNEGNVTCTIDNSRAPYYINQGLGSFDTTGCGWNSIGSAGGISGYGGNIESSYNAGAVECSVTTTGGGNTACAFAGGIVGSYLPSKTISNCYNAGNITANATNTATTGGFAVFSAHAYCGGLYGATGYLFDYNSTAFSGHNVTTKNCYNIGTTEACSTSALGEEYEYEYDGGIVGLSTSSATFENVYFDSSVDNEVGSGSYSGSITSSTASQMQNESTYSGFDFVDLWTMAGASSYAYPEIQYIAYEFDKDSIGVCDSVEIDIEDYLFFYYSQDYIEPGDTVQVGADYGDGEYGGMYYEGEVKWEISNPNVLEIVETTNNVTTIIVKAVNVGECKLTLYLDGVACRTETIFVNITDDTMINEYMDYLLDCSTLTTLKAARDSGWEIVNNISEGDKAKIAFITCLKNDLGLGIITQEIEAALGMTTGMAESAVDEVIDALMVEVFSADTSFGDKVGNFKSKYKNFTTTTKALQFGQEDAVIEALASYTSFDGKSLKKVLDLYKDYTSNTIDALELVSATALTVQYERDVVVALMNSVATAPNGAGTDLYKGLERLLNEIDNIDTYAKEKFANNFVIDKLNDLLQKGLFKVVGADKGTFGLVSSMGKLIAQTHKNEGGIFADDYMKACIGLGFAATMYSSLVNSYDAASLETSFNYYVAAVKVGLNAAIDIAGDDHYSTLLKNTAQGYLDQISTTCTYDVYIRQCRNEMNNAMEVKSLNSVVDDKIVSQAYWILPEETQTASISTYSIDEYDFYAWNFEEDQLLNIPTIIDGSVITGIADYGFSGVSSIYGVRIPDSVESIGQYSFSNCSNLYFATLGSGLKHIGAGAFYNCSNMQTINMPNCVETIGENSFYGCAKLEMISFPETTKVISGNAFNGCTSLKSIVIKNENATIEEDAFVNCAEELIIYGYSGGTVETYAQENNIQFVSLEKLVASLSIETPASTTTYCVGDAIITDGLSLNVTYTDGTNEIVSSGWIVTGNTSREGVNEVNVYYGDKVITYDIQVEKNDSKGVDILTSKSELFFGESIQLEVDSDYVVPVKWETSDNEVITINNGFITACGLGTAIISVSSNGVIQDSITLNVVNTKQIDPAEVIEDYITFTAPKTGKYVFFSENSTHVIYGSVYDLYGVKLFGNSGINFRVECVLEAGESYSFLTQCGNETNPIIVSIDYVGVPESMIISDSNGYETEYIYGNEGDSKYLYTQFLPRSSKIEPVTWYSEDGDIASVDENGYVSLNAKGKTYVHATGSSGVTDSVLVIVNESYTNLGEQMKLNEEYMLYSSVSKTSSFFPDSTGFYKINIKQSDTEAYPDIYDNVTISVTPDAYHSGYGSGYSEDGNYIYEYNTVYYFESGKEYSVTVTSNGVLPTQLMLSKVPDPTSVSLSATTLSFTEGDYGQSLYVTLSPEYTFGHYTWESSDETVATVNENGFVKPVGAGETTITAFVNGTQLSASCNVSVEGVEKTKIDISQQYTNLEVGVYYVQPSESGYYKFVFNDCYMDINDSQYNQLGWLNSSYNMACNYLEAGKMYILEITSTYSNGAYGEIQPVSAPKNVTIDNDIILTPGTLKTFYISTDASDTYFDSASSTFVIANPEIATVTSSNSRGYITQWSQFYESFFTVDGLAIGETTLTVTTKDGCSYTFPVVVEDYSSITDGANIDLTLGKNGNAIYKFTPGESASYTLEASGTQSCSIYIHDENNKYLTGVGENYWGEGHYVSIAYEFEKGKTYFVEIQGNFLYDGNFVFKLNKTVEANELDLSANNISGFVDESFALSYELLPKYSFPETVSWQSSNDTIATVDENGNVFLVGVGIATITATATNGITATCVVEVKTIPTISCDEGKEISTEIDSGIGLYKFVPEEDGTYVFYSYNNEFDTYGYLLDASMQVIDSDDDSGDGRNFKIEYSMIAGTTYYLKATPYSSSYSGTYHIAVERLFPAASIEITAGDSISQYEGSSYYLAVQFKPDNAITESVTWTSNNTSVATVTSEGRVDFIAAGTATVTATSQNGLTDSIEVVVKAPSVITVDETKTGFADLGCTADIFEFTPAEDGVYRVTVDSPNYSYLNLRDSEGNYLSNKSGYDMTADQAMTAGSTYRFEIVFADPELSGNFTIKVEKLVLATGMEIVQGESTSGFKGETISLSTSFSPEICMEESVSWSSGNNEVATVDEVGNVKLISVGTAIITATSENGLTDAIAITVKGYPAIQENVETDAVIDVGGTSSYFSFTPEEDGYYAFYAFTDTDTYGYIMDEELNVLASDDDNGEGYNFKVKYQMEAGKTYILKARYYGSEETGTIKVCIEKTRYIASLEVTALPTRLDYVKDHVSNISYKGLKLQAAWSDGSVSNWSCTSDYYFNEMIEDEWISFDTSNCETTGEIIISCGGQTTSFYINLVDNPVDHIELVSGSSHKYIENYNGYEMYGGGFYYYAYTPTDAVIKIVYLDGTSVTANVGDVVDYYSIGWEHNQYNTAWVVGTENESTVTYLGHTVNLPITVEKNKVESVEVVSGKVTCIENAYGYDMGNGYYYYYSVPSDVTVKVNYTDGSYTIANIHDVLNGYSFSWTTNQYADPWTLGDDNYVTISYLGVTGQLPVSIIPSPVDHIVINAAPTREYVYGDAEWGWLYSDGGYEFYPTDMTGISFTVHYTDGTTKTFTSADIDEQGLVDGYSYSLSFDEYVTETGEFPITFSYMGKSAEYTIKLKESTVESLSITKLPSMTQFDSYFSPDFVGTEFTITFTDGTTETVILTESNIEYVYDWNYGLTYMVDVNGNTLSIRPIYAESGRYYRAYYIDKNVEIRDFAFVDSQDVASIALGNVTSLGDNMNVTVTYQDGSTENLKLDVVLYDEYTDQVEGYAKTDKGLLYYSIDTNRNSNGEVSGYEVYLLGQTIEVEAAETVSGDVNGDGVVDTIDRMVLSRYLANWDDASENFNMIAADVNSDGVVDTLDRMILNRYLANWEGYEDILNVAS